MLNGMIIRSLKGGLTPFSFFIAICATITALHGAPFAQDGTRSASAAFEDYSRGIEFVPAKPSKKKPPRGVKPKMVPNRKIAGAPGLVVSVEQQVGCSGEWYRMRPSEVANSSDCIRPKFKANFTGNLTIINLGSSGKNKILFPTGEQANGMERNQEYYLPSKDGWKISGPAGSDQLVFLMSTTALPEPVLQKYLTLKSNVTGETPDAELITSDKRTDRDLEPVNEDGQVYVLAKRTRLAKPVILKVAIKHR